MTALSHNRLLICLLAGCASGLACGNTSTQVGPANEEPTGSSAASDTLTSGDTLAGTRGSRGSTTGSSGTPQNPTTATSPVEDVAVRADVPATSNAPGLAVFVDVAAQAGLDYVQGEFIPAPGCLVDTIFGPGNFCSPERMNGGASAADYNGDGLTDIYATVTNGPDRLFHNQGDGTFIDVLAGSGIDHQVPTSGVVWADFDNDGDQDLYVVTIAAYRNLLYINDGTGVFTEQGIARDAAVFTIRIHTGMSAAVGDYDLDGYLDLYVTEWRTTAGMGDWPSHNRLLHNLGAANPGFFEDVTETAGVGIEDVWALTEDAPPGQYGFSPAFADLDGDHWPELVVVSDFGCSRLFWNNGDGTFEDGTVAAGVGLDQNGMGSTFGDIDGDGRLDWFVTSITDNAGPENKFYRNMGARVFENATLDYGFGDAGWGWGALFFDPNNDGDLDLIAVNGYHYITHIEDYTRFWSNDGALPLPDRAVEAGLAAEAKQGRNVLTFDYEQDGDLDLFIVNNSQAAELYRNTNGNLGDWLRVQTVGTTSNRDGIGAKITVTVGEASQYRELNSASHYMGQSERIAHFGLPGSEATADVRVYWPVTDQEQVFVGVARNTTLVVTEP